MADKPVPPTVASLADSQGYVTVYDHGPQPAPSDATDEAKKTAVANKKDWDALNPDGVVVLRMATTDAGHAMAVEPARYSLEPTDLDEGAIAAKMAEIRKRREAMVKSKEDAADRQQAIGEVLSDKVNARAAKAAEPVKPVMRPAQVPHFVPPAPEMDHPPGSNPFVKP